MCVYEVWILENRSNASYEATQEVQLSVRKSVIHRDLGGKTRLGFSQEVS